MAVVRILGVDPGTLVVGFGCVELVAGPGGAAPPASEAAAGAGRQAVPLALRAANTVRAAGGGSVRPVECGVLRLGGRGRPLPQRLWSLADQLRELLQRLQPAELALEEAFYGKSVSAALRIGESRGVVLAEAARAGLGVHQYAPARIKRSVTGLGAATKAAVAAMVLQQLGATNVASGAIPADATDALAAALARVEERRSPMLQPGCGADAALVDGVGSDGGSDDGAGPVLWPRRRSRRR